jgi:hypothetical protein
MLHPLLSIVPPLLFLLSLDQLLRVLVPGIPWFPRHLAPLLIVAAVEEAVMGNLLFKERASFVARVRELALLLALVFGYLFISFGVRSSVGFRVTPELIYPLTATVLQWLFSHGIHSALRERELLLNALTAKRGAALRHTLRDSSYQAGLTIRVLRNVKAGIVAFQFLVIALLITAAVLKRQPASGGTLVIALHTIGGLLVLGMLNSFEEQQLLLGSGNPLPLALERRKLLFCLVILGIAAAAVILAARNASLLPLSALIALLRRLASLFRLPVGPGLSEALQNALIERQRYYQAMRLSQPLPPAPGPLALLMVEAARRLLRTLLGTAVFLFLVSPLLSRDFVERLRELRPFAALWKRLNLLLGFALRFWLRFLRWLRFPRRQAGLTVEEEGRLPAESRSGMAKTQKLSVRKRVQMNRVQRAFLTLIRWGEKRGVSYAIFLTPLEYSQKLAAAIHADLEKLSYVVDVFEEVMFSAHLVASASIARYMRMIRMLRHTTPEGSAEAERIDRL